MIQTIAFGHFQETELGTGGGRMRKKASWIMIVLLVSLTGCAQVSIYSSSPTTRYVSNDYFNAEFEPQKAEGKNYFNAFRIVFKNKTDEDLIIDWSKTYYLLNGRENGRFGWEGMTFEELKEIKSQPLVTIHAGNTYSEVIFPLKLIALLGSSLI